MNRFLKIMLMFVVGFFALAYFVVPALFPPFYYAEYNRLAENLKSIEGLEIVGGWQHHDMTMEGCGFTLRSGDSESVKVSFFDNEDWDAPFESLDGVVFTYPRVPGLNVDPMKTYLNAEDFKEIGIELTSLKDVLANLEEAITLAKSREQLVNDKTITGQWITIVYEEAFRDGEIAKAGKVSERAPLTGDFLRLFESLDHDWTLEKKVDPALEVYLFEAQQVKPTVEALVNCWLGEGDEALVRSLEQMIPSSQDGMVRVADGIALIWTNSETVIVYREGDFGFHSEVWKKKN